MAPPQARGGTADPSAPAPSAESAESAEVRRPATFTARVRSLVRAIEENDEAKVEEAILRLSRSRRIFAPLAFAISAFVMLFQGLRLLVSNWRLTLVQILPAVWIWLAMLDLKAHVLHGKSFHVLRGPVLIPIVLLLVMFTVVPARSFSSSDTAGWWTSRRCGAGRYRTKAAARLLDAMLARQRMQVWTGGRCRCCKSPTAGRMTPRLVCAQLRSYARVLG